MTPPESLRARVLAAAAAKKSPTRKQGKRLAVVLAIASLVIAVTCIELAGGLEHSVGRPLGLTIAIASGWTLFAVFLTWLVFGRGGSTLPRRPMVVLAAALAAPIALLVWMTTFHGTYEEPFERVGFRCMGLSMVIALAPLAGFLFLRRGTEPRRPSALGAGAGAVCGAWAAVAVDLWCPLTSSSHVLVGHVVPLVVLIGLGALLGSRLLRRA